MRYFAEKNSEIVTHNKYILLDKVQYVLPPAPWNSPLIRISVNYFQLFSFIR